MKKIALIAAMTAASLVAGCTGGDEEGEAAASCTMQELQEKATALATGLQSNPSAAMGMMEEMQKLGTDMQAVASSGGTDKDALAEVCAGYDKLLAEL